MESGFDDFEITFYERLVREKPDYIEALAVLAEAYTARGEYQKGLEMDKQLSEYKPEDAVVLYNLACSYALVTNKESALSTLEKSISLGYTDYEHIRKDADLKSLHQDVRFQSLLGRLKTQHNRHPF